MIIIINCKCQPLPTTLASAPPPEKSGEFQWVIVAGDSLWKWEYFTRKKDDLQE